MLSVCTRLWSRASWWPLRQSQSWKRQDKSQKTIHEALRLDWTNQVIWDSKTLPPREHERVLGQRRQLQPNENELKYEVWRTTDRKQRTKCSSRSSKFKTMKKMAISDVSLSRPYRADDLSALVARRHGSHGYEDLKVFHTWPWLLFEELNTHEQSLKTDEHTSISSNSWAIVKTLAQSLKSQEQNSSWKLLRRN